MPVLSNKKSNVALNALFPKILLFSVFWLGSMQGPSPTSSEDEETEENKDEIKKFLESRCDSIEDLDIDLKKTKSLASLIKTFVTPYKKLKKFKELNLNQQKVLLAYHGHYLMTNEPDQCPYTIMRKRSPQSKSVTEQFEEDLNLFSNNLSVYTFFRDSDGLNRREICKRIEVVNEAKILDMMRQSVIYPETESDFQKFLFNPNMFCFKVDKTARKFFDQDQFEKEEKQREKRKGENKQKDETHQEEIEKLKEESEKVEDEEERKKGSEEIEKKKKRYEKNKKWKIKSELKYPFYIIYGENEDFSLKIRDMTSSSGSYGGSFEFNVDKVKEFLKKKSFSLKSSETTFLPMLTRMKTLLTVLNSIKKNMIPNCLYRPNLLSFRHYNDFGFFNKTKSPLKAFFKKPVDKDFKLYTKLNLKLLKKQEKENPESLTLNDSESSNPKPEENPNTLKFICPENPKSDSEPFLVGRSFAENSVFSLLIMFSDWENAVLHTPLFKARKSIQKIKNRFSNTDHDSLSSESDEEMETLKLKYEYFESSLKKDLPVVWENSPNAFDFWLTESLNIFEEEFRPEKMRIEGKIDMTVNQNTSMKTKYKKAATHRFQKLFRLRRRSLENELKRKTNEKIKSKLKENRKTDDFFKLPENFDSQIVEPFNRKKFIFESNLKLDYIPELFSKKLDKTKIFDLRMAYYYVFRGILMHLGIMDGLIFYENFKKNIEEVDVPEDHLKYLKAQKIGWKGFENQKIPYENFGLVMFENTESNKMGEPKQIFNPNITFEQLKKEKSFGDFKIEYLIEVLTKSIRIKYMSFLLQNMQNLLFVEGDIGALQKIIRNISDQIENLISGFKKMIQLFEKKFRTKNSEIGIEEVKKKLEEIGVVSGMDWKYLDGPLFDTFNAKVISEMKLKKETENMKKEVDKKASKTHKKYKTKPKTSKKKKLKLKDRARRLDLNFSKLQTAENSESAKLAIDPSRDGKQSLLRDSVSASNRATQPVSRLQLENRVRRKVKRAVKQILRQKSGFQHFLVC